jgi:hypothetical protein
MKYKSIKLNMFLSMLLVLAITSTTSCEAKKNKADGQSIENKLNMSSEVNSYSQKIITDGSSKASYYDGLSRFLSGIKVSKESKFYKKTQTKYYKKHIRVLKNFWGKVERNTLGKVQKWQKTNVPKTHNDHVAFYPLSGADFINLNLMYPDASNYLMVALEDPGFVPNIDNLNHRRMSLGLNFIQRGLNLYGKNNYFATVVMKYRMTQNRYIKGITPIFMIFMTRMGHSIVDVKPVGIGKGGKLYFINKKGKIDKYAASNKGVMIHFKDRYSGKIKRLVYIKAYLNKKNLSNTTRTGKYFNGIGRTKTMMKSAIYLCHIKKYIPVAHWIIKKSDILIQDDSAIPYKYIPKTWETKLYGNYIPMKLIGCPLSYQKDLAREYRKRKQNLPFFFGYGILWGKNKSNLLIAIRK